uniref:Ankyrin repeat protein n=1 Tax=Mycena chlorophos TaxID=658473 RepID=A0ABQ0LN75_MYCCL|nr:ankyrin repeat protein [Mycena chlorophos]
MSFLDLPPELHLRIAETALVNDVSRDNPPSVFLDTLQSSFSPVQDLPEQLPDLLSMNALARTCKYLHRTLNNSLYIVCARNVYVGRLMLLFAVENQLEGLFDRLLEFGVPADAFYAPSEWFQHGCRAADIKPRSSELVTLLYVAASKPATTFVAKVLAAIPTASARSSLAYRKTRNDGYQTPIMLATRSGELQSVRVLSRIAAPPDHKFTSDADARCDYLSRALIATCATRTELRRLEALELLIDEGADVDLDDGEALAWSCLNNDEAAVRMLLKAGAAPVYPNITPTNPDIIRVLADAGADLDEVTSYVCDLNLSALQRAVDEQADVDIVRALLECGADVHIRNAIGETILHFACLGPIGTPDGVLPKPPDNATVELLLQFGAARYIAEPDLEDGHTPIAIAKRSRYMDVLDLFLLYAEDEVVAQDLREYLEDSSAGRKRRRALV